MNLIKMAWGLVPAPAKIWVAIAGVLMALAAVGFMVWKIDAGGYNRCEAKYAAAALEHQTDARWKILKVEDKYDGVKEQIYRKAGPNDPVGPRVELAIDSLPRPSDRK